LAEAIATSVGENSSPSTLLRPTLRQGRALELVFLGGLVARVTRTRPDGRVAFIYDSKKALEDELRILELPADDAERLNVHGSGIIFADSRTVPGLQLADVVAFTFNRLFRIKHKLEVAGSLGPFDEVLLDVASALGPRVINLMSSTDPA